MKKNQELFLTPAPEIFHSGGSGSGQTVTDEETTTGKLSSSAASSSWSRNSGYNWAAAGDDVDTTLCLCQPGTIIHDHHNQNQRRNASLLLPDIDLAGYNWAAAVDGDLPAAGDDVDTTLRLCPPGTIINHPAADDNQNQKKASLIHTDIDLAVAGDDLQHSKNKMKKTSREQDADADADASKKKKRKYRKKGSSNDQRPLVPIEEIEGLMRMVKLKSDSEAVVKFLYKKTLQETDVTRRYGRLLITSAEREKLMAFLEEEEKAALLPTGNHRLEVTAVDSGGNVYPTLLIKRWPVSDAMVIHTGWDDVLDNNAADKGHVVEIWGYKHRHTHKSALAFHFRTTTTTTDDHNNNNGAAAELVPTQSPESSSLPNIAA